ncbi:MAG: leucyl aminopeptidase [Anaerolineae bacterium]|nr:leucyl aminopeptidase [Thermoflexales bacterium]MDW8406789.1 leucyl aminopeptidase [Anaerolineae bacterium]
MNIRILHDALETIRVDALVVGLAQPIVPLTGAVTALDHALRGAIGRLIELGDFSGKVGEAVILYSNGLIPAPRLVLVGLGDRARLRVDLIRQAAGVALRKARDLRCRQVAAWLPDVASESIRASDLAQAVVEGALMGTWRFAEHKSEPDGPSVEHLMIVASRREAIDDMRRGAESGQIVGEAVNTARALAQQPANVMTPPALADQAFALAQEAGLSCTILDEHQIAEQGMGGVLAVARGSAHPPRLVILEHAGQGGAPLVFIGKGVTFDSGGLSLKEPSGMETMKADMSGAAAVISALAAIARLGLPRRVIGLAPLVENMPDGRAYRPGDVVKMMSGYTVEIISTDAEGRLTLADALHYAKRYKPAGVVDLATLTGASVVALGEGVAAALFANDNAWAKTIRAAAGFCGERVWRMPLYPEYAGKLRSDTADMKNTAGRTGGVGASAWFLKRFVDGKDGYPWAHIDMAGMMLATDARGYQPKGATGFGVRTFIRLAEMDSRR